MTSGAVAEMIDRILATLDMGERTMDREQAVTMVNKFNKIVDSKLSWIKTTQKLISVLNIPIASAAVYNIFNRTTFEEWYSLEWQ